ncbi:hypothetical protein AB5I41_17305 [Sphingomonas sp. MMS24-JH45]
MPILSQGIIGLRVRAAIAGQQQAEFLVEATRRAVDQQVLTSWNQVISSRDQTVAGYCAMTARDPRWKACGAASPRGSARTSRCSIRNSACSTRRSSSPRRTIPSM